MGTYFTLRPQLRSGDLVFFREHTFWSRLIRRATMSDYCHCGVVLVKGGDAFVVEARQAQGVTMRLLEEALPCDWIATGCNWTEEVETDALMRLQTHYSAFAAIALGLGIKPPGQTEVCSLCAGSIIQAGLPGVQIPRRGLTPGLLGEIFMAAGLPNRTLN